MGGGGEPGRMLKMITCATQEVIILKPRASHGLPSHNHWRYEQIGHSFRARHRSSAPLQDDHPPRGEAAGYLTDDDVFRDVS
jgi:hypothetical protein